MITSIPRPKILPQLGDGSWPLACVFAASFRFRRWIFQGTRHPPNPLRFFSYHYLIFEFIRSNLPLSMVDPLCLDAHILLQWEVIIAEKSKSRGPMTEDEFSIRFSLLRSSDLESNDLSLQAHRPFITTCTVGQDIGNGGTDCRRRGLLRPGCGGHKKQEQEGEDSCGLHSQRCVRGAGRIFTPARRAIMPPPGSLGGGRAGDIIETTAGAIVPNLPSPKVAANRGRRDAGA